MQYVTRKSSELRQGDVVACHGMRCPSARTAAATAAAAAAERERRELVAEYVVLDRYDDVRKFAGHDYGSGQRVAELIRRRRELDATDHELAAEASQLDADELAAAFERVGRPAVTRARALAELAGYADVPRTVAGLYAKRAAAIVAAYAAGATPTEIASLLGVSRKIVYDAIGAK